jgi:hypothetical protein
MIPDNMKDLGMDTHSVGEHYRQELGSKSFAQQSKAGAVDGHLNCWKLNLSDMLVEASTQPLRVRAVSHAWPSGTKAIAGRDHR